MYYLIAVFMQTLKNIIKPKLNCLTKFQLTEKQGNQKVWQQKNSVNFQLLIVNESFYPVAQFAVKMFRF